MCLDHKHLRGAGQRAGISAKEGRGLSAPVSGSHDLWGRQQKQKLGFIGAEAEWEPFLLNSDTKTGRGQQRRSWQEVSLKAN